MVLSPPEGDCGAFLGELSVTGDPRDLNEDVILTGACFFAGDLFIESDLFKGESGLFKESALLTGDPRLFLDGAEELDSCLIGEPVLYVESDCLTGNEVCLTGDVTTVFSTFFGTGSDGFKASVSFC